MRYQGTNAVGEVLSSMYVERDETQRWASDTANDEPSATRQEFAAECDINNLMAQYEKTGVINHFNRQEPEYLDLSDAPDLQTAINAMRDAEMAFMRLPAVVRREFDNDAVKFVEFAQDEANVDKMREWGLAKPAPVEPPPTRVEVVNPPSEPTAK